MKCLSSNGWACLKDELVGLENGTPAQILEHILKKKWTISPDEKDMIVMWHKFVYNEGNETKQIQSYMAIEGEERNQYCHVKNSWPASRGICPTHSSG